MWDLLSLIRWLLLDLVRSRRSLEAENLALRHQLNVLRRSAPNGGLTNIHPWRASQARHQAVADEFQDLAAVLMNGLGLRIEQGR
jgi:hypothetical protein